MKSLRTYAEWLAYKLRIKITVLRLIQPECRIRTILGPIGQKIRVVGIGKYSIAIWRIHEAEVRDVRCCGAKALFIPPDN